MAPPDPGMVRDCRVHSGIKASCLFLILVLAVLQILVPDSVYAFRIRDVTPASLEQTRPSCNPLLGKCADQKVSGTYSTFRLRRRLESSAAVPPRTNKVKPLVADSGEGDESGENVATSASFVKLKSGKATVVRVEDNARVQFKTSHITKTIVGNSGRGNAGLKVALESSDEDNDGGETGENSADEEDEVVDLDDDDDDEEKREHDEDDDEEKSEHDDEDDDEENEAASASRDITIDEAEFDDTDEEEDNEEIKEVDDDESDDSEGKDGEHERYIDSDNEDVTGTVDVASPRIEHRIKIERQDVTSDNVNVKLVTSSNAASVETELKKDVENFIEKKEDVRIDGSSEEDDRVQNREIMNDRPGVDEDEAIDARVETESSKFTESDVDDADSATEYKVTPSPRKLEKVRLADKSTSMEMSRFEALETLSEKIEPEKVEQVVAEPKKIEYPKPAAPIAQKSQVKQGSKTAEKVSPSPVIQATKKPAIREKAKVAPQPKRETKSQSKRSEEPRVKVSEVKPHQKTEKLRAKSKNRTEASITLPELNDLLLHVPSFAPNFTAIKDTVCQQHGKIFLRQLRGYKLWALQMLDSSAKIPSGLLRGNLNQLGDFDQCVGVKAYVKVEEKTVKVQGKYCLATIDLQATRQDMKIPVNLMQSRAFLRGSMNEPTHFVPRFTTMNWAICVPAVCSPEDVRSVIEDALSAYNVSTGLKFTVGIESDSCYVKQKAQPYSKETVAVLYFYAMTVCLVLVATMRDFCVASDKQGSYSERIIMAFSLRRTTAALTQGSQAGDDIGCIYGIRTLATIFLYFGHKLIITTRVPFANRISLSEAANNPLSSILRVSLVHADSFLLVSGVLTAYNMTKELSDRGEIRWFCRFVTKFLRLTPVLLATVFWYAFVMEHVGSGPQWNSVVRSNAELCKQNAWTNLLHIQNFFPFEEMCATHTVQMALEMQLFLIAPMLVFFLYCKPVIGILVIFFFLQVSATVRFLSTANNYLSVVIFHGMTLKHFYKSANLAYSLPLHRATPYLFGVALGVLMRYTGKQFRIHKVLVIVGWLAATALGSWSLLSTWRLARRDYTYDVEEASYHAVILPLSWAASLSWIIFASFTDHGGIMNKFLSNYWMVVLSRLSYSVYLTQFAVFFYNVATTRYSSEFQVHRSIDLYELATIYTISMTLTLLLDLPMGEVKNVIMECTDGFTIDELKVEKKNATVTAGADYQKVKEMPEKSKAFVEEEMERTSWHWQRDEVAGRKTEVGYLDDEYSEVWNYGKDGSGRKSYVEQREDDEEIPTWDWIKTPAQNVPRRSNDGDKDSKTEKSQSGPELSESEYTDNTKKLKRTSLHQPRDEDKFRRDLRSQSRASESRRILATNSDESYRDSNIRNDQPSITGESKRSSVKDFDDTPRNYPRRERSLAKEKENSSSSARRTEEKSSWDYVNRERSASQSAKDGKKSFAEGLDVQSAALRLSTRSLTRASELRKRKSSESEEEQKLTEKPTVARMIPTEEPRVSDEETWERELRLRRQKIVQNVPARETGTASEEEEWNILKRRSSAEGRMALLNDPPEIEHFGGWSISKVPYRGSGAFPHEHSESEEENAYVATRTDFRETRPPFREGYDTQSEEEISWDRSRQRSYTSGSQPTSIDEEEGSGSHDFVLRKGSKRASLQNLSKISQEEPEVEDDSGWDFVKEENTDSSSAQTTSTGLFKRASIVRSQASEEEPEYMLPERPKLVEQEQEHPFKKAWQMQKSRSEEDGPVGFLVKEKDLKPRLSGTEGRKDSSQENEGKRKPLSGGQSEDLSYFGGDEAESTSVSYPASNSGDSANLDWAEEDERSGASGGIEESELDSLESVEKDGGHYVTRKKEQKRHSEESNWEWNQEET